MAVVIFNWPRFRTLRRSDEQSGKGRCCRLVVSGSVAILYLLVSSALRMTLWWAFARPSGAPFTHLPPILGLGVMNDLLMLVCLLVPVSLYAAFTPDRWWRSRIHRRIYPVALFGILFLLVYLSAVEYFFFDEFTSRFNLVAVDYLIYPQEVFGNIWASYPVARVVLVASFVSAALAFLGWRMSREAFDKPCRVASRSFGLLVHLGLALSALSLSSDSLALSHDRVERELEMNGFSTFFRALRTHDIQYNDFYRTRSDQAAFGSMRALLASEGARFASAVPTDLRRVHPARPNGLGPMNVVVIVEESFGANFVGVAGDPRHLTPHFDALARKGIYFSETYATGTRTVRGLEAVTTSFPPIPSESILKRPGSQHIASWGSVMRSLGYQTSFLYGGYGTFDHMNAFYASNGFQVSDRTNIENETFGNIWGACDQDLFNHVARYFDDQAADRKPFFSIIMTTSNHKPFTFPQGIPGIPSKGGGRYAGVRYADYALGEFFRKAEKHSWFGNTLFVVIADHGARVYGRTQIPMPTYHIPFLIYAPGHLKPSRVTDLTSQMDVAPTVLALLGLPYTAPFYGRDALAFDPRPHDILLSHNHDVALYRDGEIVVLGLHGTADTYLIDPHTGAQTEAPDDRELTNTAVSYFQTAFEQFERHQYR